MSIISKKNINQMIVEYFLDQIQTGKLKKGDKIKSERDLAEELGVSRVPLREAICSLNIIGLFEPRQGDGTFVTSECDAAILGRLFYDYAVLENCSIVQILDGRTSIEVSCAISAAKHGTLEEKEAIFNLAQQYTATISVDELTPEILQTAQDIDVRLHNSIARATHNQFLHMLFELVSESFNAMYEGIMGKHSIIDALEILEEIGESHILLADAIRNGNERIAAKNMQQHCTQFKQQLISELDEAARATQDSSTDPFSSEDTESVIEEYM